MSDDNPYAGLSPTSIPSLHQRLQFFAHLCKVPVSEDPDKPFDFGHRLACRPDSLTVNELRECFKIVEGYCKALGPKAEVNPEMVNGLVTFAFIGWDPKEKPKPLSRVVECPWENSLWEEHPSSKVLLDGMYSAYTHREFSTHTIFFRLHLFQHPSPLLYQWIVLTITSSW